MCGPLNVQIERMEHNLTVGATDKGMASARELRTQLLKIEDFAVENKGIPAVGGRHRLSSERRQIDDGEAPVPEPNRAVDVLPLTVRTTMGDGIGHRLDANRRTGRHDNEDQRNCEVVQ